MGIQMISSSGRSELIVLDQPANVSGKDRIALGMIKRIVKYFRDQRAYRKLLAMSPERLEDMGLTHAKVADAAKKPIWETIL